MLPPVVWVTVSQRTELLPIVRLTDGFRRTNHFVAEAYFDTFLGSQPAFHPAKNFRAPRLGFTSCLLLWERHQIFTRIEAFYFKVDENLKVDKKLQPSSH